jgi:hypothetical protein
MDPADASYRPSPRSAPCFMRRGTHPRSPAATAKATNPAHQANRARNPVQVVVSLEALGHPQARSSDHPPGLSFTGAASDQAGKRRSSTDRPAWSVPPDAGSARPEPRKRPRGASKTRAGTAEVPGSWPPQSDEGLGRAEHAPAHHSRTQGTGWALRAASGTGRPLSTLPLARKPRDVANSPFDAPVTEGALHVETLSTRAPAPLASGIEGSDERAVSCPTNTAARLCSVRHAGPGARSEEPTPAWRRTMSPSIASTLTGIARGKPSDPTAAKSTKGMR